MRLFHGNVVLAKESGEGLGEVLRGLEIHTKDNKPAKSILDCLTTAQLSFLSAVDTAAVPFYLICGQPFEVYTCDEATEERMFELLVGDEVPDGGSTDGEPFLESRTSLLLQVHKRQNASSKTASQHEIKYLLVYAASMRSNHKSSKTSSGLITPPRSSSPSLPSTILPTDPSIKIYALPLRSEESFNHELAVPSPPPSPKKPTVNNECYFLDTFTSSSTDSKQAQHDTPAQNSADHPDAPVRKRPRLDTVFSSVSSKPLSRNGRGVSKLMAKLDGQSRSASFSSQRPYTPTLLTPLTAPISNTHSAEDTTPTTATTEQPAMMVRKRPKTASSEQQQPRAGLSRSYTTGHIAPRPSISGPSTAAPAPSALLHRRTGSLHHRVTSLASGVGSRATSVASDDNARASPVPPQDTSRPGTRDGSIGAENGLVTGSAVMATGNMSVEVQNKNTLSRCVMAGLRLWGYSQVKIQAVTAENGDTQERSAEMITKEDVLRQKNEDYKMLYHQTLKAAWFALRRCSAEQIVPQMRMNDVVEKVLELFCGEEREGLIGAGATEVRDDATI